MGSNPTLVKRGFGSSLTPIFCLAAAQVWETAARECLSSRKTSSLRGRRKSRLRMIVGYSGSCHPAVCSSRLSSAVHSCFLSAPFCDQTRVLNDRHLDRHTVYLWPRLMRGSAGAEPLAFAAWEADEEGKGPPRFQRKHSNTLSAIRRPPPTALTPPDTSVSVSTPSCCPTVLNEKGSVGVMLRAGRRVDLLRAHQGGRGGAGPFRPQQQGAGAVSVSGLFPSFHQATRISMSVRGGEKEATQSRREEVSGDLELTAKVLT